jgi:hypothetical protein
MPAHDPSERTLVSRIAANAKWARTPDRSAATAPAREALASKWERDVDPEGALSPAVRARLAESAKKEFYARLQLKSAQARRLRRRASQMDAEVRSALDEGAAA